jgi:lipopolysaccharide cholinephosphotransferase
MTNQNKLRQLQLTELEILKEVVRICETNKIEYFLDSGTALGAVRHGGFIPWDDDIDIGMARPHYEKFLRLAKKQLGEAYFLQTVETDPNAPYYFAKVRKKGTSFMEWNKRNLNMHHGIYIDIFPYDNLPNKKEERQHFQQKCHRIYSFWSVRTIPDRVAIPQKNYKWLIKAIVRRFFHLASLIIPRTLIYRHMNQTFQQYNHKETEYLACLAFSDTCTFRRSDLFPLKMGTFERCNFTLANDVDSYLKELYGDYMRLPPKEEQVTHLTNIIHFQLEPLNSNQ